MIGRYSMIKYSIIIPVYGCEKYLEPCVKSVIKQKGNHSYEIILVDDGSKDSSGEIADQLAQQYEQVKTVHKKNGGAASARNRGIKEAKGKYIIFIDGDDTVDENLLDIVNKELETNEHAMVIFGMSFDYYRNDVFERCDKLSCSHNGIYTLNELFFEYKDFFFDNALSSACNKVFMLDKIKNNNLLFEEGMTLYEDYDFVLRYMMCVEFVICLNNIFYHYRNILEDTHINYRVLNLSNLQANLSHLLVTVNGLSELKSQKLNFSQLLDISANLYLQFLIQNLMIKKYSHEELQNSLKIYCNDSNFRAILAAGGKLEEKNKKLLRQIDYGEYRQINREYKKKRLIMKNKKIVKNLLRITGLLK